MKMPRLSYRVRAADMIPKGYGIAYRLWNQDTVVVLPIPLNIIVRVILNCYYALVKAWFPSHWERELDKRWHYGYKMGREDRQHEIEMLKHEIKIYKDFIRETPNGRQV